MRISLSEGRLRPRVLPKAERVRCPRAGRYGPFPGGLGIILPALGPAREVLHWTGTGYGAGNTRGAACGPRPEGRPKDRTLRPRPRKHGLTPSLGDESPFGESREWNAGRRAASRDGGRAAPLGAEDKGSASSGVPLPFSRSRERKEEAKAPRLILKVEEPRSENPQRRQKTRSGNDDLFSPLPTELGCSRVRQY